MKKEHKFHCLTIAYALHYQLNRRQLLLNLEVTVDPGHRSDIQVNLLSASLNGLFLSSSLYSKVRIFCTHVIFKFFVCGGFRMKIKYMEKVQSKSGNKQRSATVRKFHACERTSESPGYKN